MNRLLRYALFYMVAGAFGLAIASMPAWNGKMVLFSLYLLAFVALYYGISRK